MWYVVGDFIDDVALRQNKMLIDCELPNYCIVSEFLDFFVHLMCPHVRQGFPAIHRWNQNYG